MKNWLIRKYYKTAFAMTKDLFIEWRRKDDLLLTTPCGPRILKQSRKIDSIARRGTRKLTWIKILLHLLGAAPVKDEESQRSKSEEGGK